MLIGHGYEKMEYSGHLCAFIKTVHLFRVTLMNIFDMFDFDENGTLNRAEFDVFNVVGSDEHVSDQVSSLTFLLMTSCDSKKQFFKVQLVLHKYRKHQVHETSRF
uniref:EF-hand domain-containing protein n=1 Tax=Parascaris equorum TaxID=6256 RepID=A0A914RPI6_PAREQ